MADTLFPYIRRELRGYLTKNWNEKETQNDVEGLRQLYKQDLTGEQNKDKSGIPVIGDDAGQDEELQNQVIRNIEWQMDSDRKSTALKALQGHMWRSGYSSGELKGHLYEDVPSALQKIQDKHIPIYIYSSGSIEAQKLLFGNTVAGNLLNTFKGHYDTTIGLKTESQSYKNISQDISIPPQHLLFVTDNILEGYAAQKSNWQVVIADRPGNKPLPSDNPFPVVTSLSQLFTLQNVPWTL